MKVGISSAVMYPMQAEKAILKLKQLGFDTFEFFYNCDEEISEEYIAHLKKENEDISFISLHPYTAFAEGVMFFSGYERRTEESLQKYRRIFRIAKKLGVSFFTLHGDRAQKSLSDDDCGLSDKNAEALSRLSKAAREEGVFLCLENVSWCKSGNISYLEAVAERVPDVFFTLDMKQARRANVPYEKYISVMSDRILNVHVSDFNAESDCILPGEGELDFEKLKRELLSVGYKGDVLIEVYSDCIKNDLQIQKSKAFLDGIFLK